jgi:O-methyltransferase involved in polyketide biosynthesis
MLVSDISDTARWVAYARAIESDRPDALFHDGLARALAGKVGEAIAHQIGAAEYIARSIAVRTVVLDELLLQALEQHQVDLVLNIAAGLDSRPWRLRLPRSLLWLDVDLPNLLDYKTAIVGSEKTTCRYEQLPADVSKFQDRIRMLDRCSGARRGLVVTEGFLIHLRPERVAALASILYEQAALTWWLTDITGPRDSPDFFRRLGWREVLFRSSHDEAKRLNRGAPMPLLSRILLRLSPASVRAEFRRLSGIALLERDDVSA